KNRVTAVRPPSRGEQQGERYEHHGKGQAPVLSNTRGKILKPHVGRQNHSAEKTSGSGEAEFIGARFWVSEPNYECCRQEETETEPHQGDVESRRDPDGGESEYPPNDQTKVEQHD